MAAISVREWLFGRRGTAETPVPTGDGNDLVYLDPLNYDPTNVPALAAPQIFWSSVAQNFFRSVSQADHISSMNEQGVVQGPVNEPINMATAVQDNAAFGPPNEATGAPDHVRMSSVMRHLEDRLLPIQDFLLGAP